jgi:L-ribulose-5-phosphate 4-epimerase
MSKYQSLKEEAYEANMQLPKLGLVLFSFGNASVADRNENVFAIKPSGVPYNTLTADEMVVLDLEGKLVEGILRQSSDTNTHLVLYNEWKEIKSVVHTHSTFATAWAQSLRDIPIYGTTHADHFLSVIPCISPMSDELIQTNYEIATGFQIINYLKEKNISYEDLEMILIGSHAPFTWGRTSAKAVYNSALLEQIAHLAYLTEQINPTAPTLKDALIKKHYERKHGPAAYYGQRKL